ncbi:MAG: hypothetical protein ACR2ML_10830 [Solirubrobacteraceae bacterium]
MRSALAVITAALLVIAGCGGDDGGGGGEGSAPSDERTAVVDATRAYQDAFLEEDADAVCDHLSGRGKRELVVTAAALGGPVSCPDSAKRVFDLAGEDDRQRIKRSREQLKPGDVRLHGQQATVTLPASGRKLGLRKAGAKWLISVPGLRRP